MRTGEHRLHPAPMPPLSPYSLITAAIPGTAGVLRKSPEDFLVEELPLIEPAGRGDYVLLFIQKRKLSTLDVARRITRLLRLESSAVGYAGLKDKHAITRQLFSLRWPATGNDDSLQDKLSSQDMQVLWHTRHDQPLRPGDLAGNRFVIRIREVNPVHVRHALATLQQLQRTGVPNFVGEQRFGYRGTNHLIGRELLHHRPQAVLDRMLGEPSADDAPWAVAGRAAYLRGDYAQALDAWPGSLYHERHLLDLLRQGCTAAHCCEQMQAPQRELLFSAVQGHVFNQVLEQRTQRGDWNRLLAGDIAFDHSDRSTGLVDAQAAERLNQPAGEVANLRVSPTGPMWGKDMPLAAGAVAELELRALQEFGLTPQEMQQAPPLDCKGARRPLRAVLANTDVSAGVDDQGPYIRVAFDLPRGCYATVVMREIMKPQAIRANPSPSRATQLDQEPEELA